MTQVERIQQALALAGELQDLLDNVIAEDNRRMGQLLPTQRYVVDVWRYSLRDMERRLKEAFGREPQ